MLFQMIPAKQQIQILMALAIMPITVLMRQMKIKPIAMQTVRAMRVTRCQKPTLRLVILVRKVRTA